MKLPGSKKVWNFYSTRNVCRPLKETNNALWMHALEWAAAESILQCDGPENVRVGRVHRRQKKFGMLSLFCSTHTRKKRGENLDTVHTVTTNSVQNNCSALWTFFLYAIFINLLHLWVNSFGTNPKSFQQKIELYCMYVWIFKWPVDGCCVSTGFARERTDR